MKRTITAALVVLAFAVLGQNANPLPGYGLASWENLDCTKALLQKAQQKLKDGTLTPDDRVRIVFYGQSLAAKDNAWAAKIFPAEMIKKYGDIFTFDNKARGGWVAGWLLAIYLEDLKGTNPDLIIIHDYPSPKREYYAYLLFDGIKTKAQLDEWYNTIKPETEANVKRFKLTKENFDNKLGKPGLRNMTNSRGNRVEVLLLADHIRNATGKDGATGKDVKYDKFDKYGDENSFQLYPKWAKEQQLGYLDLRSLWKEVLIKEHGNTLSESRAPYLWKDGEHLAPAGQKLWAYCVLRYFDIVYDYHEAKPAAKK
jgi:hypothetical protein